METLCDIRFYLRQVFYENKKVRECWPQLLHNLDKTSVFKSFCPKLHPKLYPSLLYSLRLKIMSSQGWAIPNSLVVWDLVKMCFLPVNLSQTKDSGSNNMCPGRVQTPRTPGKPIRIVVLEKKWWVSINLPQTMLAFLLKSQSRKKYDQNELKCPKLQYTL